ncbi:solute carrier organic anion transporter family member 2B1-like isoform X2 [Ostrea edulis]|nr:solute carrier organic anion transporter family member 2B1-like isoform X2 [Ostrea edulis]
MYVTLEEVDMDHRDPRWIGAWWLGFIVFGIISIFLAAPLPFFPRRMKMSPKDIAKGKFQERPMMQDCSFRKKFKMSVTSYRRIVRNPIYMLTCVSQIFNMMAVGGWSAFSSKFMMTHFNIPLYLANYILAGANISTVAMGTFFGGLLTRKIAMTPRNVYRMMTFFFMFNVIFVALAMTMSCPQPTIVGHSLDVPGYVDAPSQNCTPNCSCQSDGFYPICGSNKVNYHSPCSAGCAELLRNGRMFSNCSCIPDGRAEAGLCEDVCSNLIPWVIFIFLASISDAFKIPPTIVAIMRSVDDTDKAAGLGLFSCATSGLGWGLSPILFGKMLDVSCYIWQSPCLSTGACELYDLRLFRLSFHGLCVLCKGLSLACLLYLMVWTRNWQEWKSSQNTELSEKVDVKYTKVSSGNMILNSEKQDLVENEDDTHRTSGIHLN